MYFANNDVEKALLFYEKALGIHRETGHKLSEAIVLSNLGKLFYKQSDSARAEKFYRQSLEIHKEIGNPLNEGLTILNICDILISNKNYDDALKNYAIAFNMIRKIQHIKYKAAVYAKTGIFYMIRNQFEKSDRHLIKALRIYRHLKDKIKEADVINNLGLNQCYLRNYSKGYEFYLKVLEILKPTSIDLSKNDSFNKLESILQAKDFPINK